MRTARRAFPLSVARTRRRDFAVVEAKTLGRNVAVDPRLAVDERAQPSEAVEVDLHDERPKGGGQFWRLCDADVAQRATERDSPRFAQPVSQDRIDVIRAVVSDDASTVTKAPDDARSSHRPF